MTKPGVTIGRDPGLDWVLPDPSRMISGRHCDIRFENGAYWLYDHSTNGVFVNGSTQRLNAPHRLVHGDRLTIGRCLVAVAITEAAHAQEPSGPGRTQAVDGRRDFGPAPANLSAGRGNTGAQLAGRPRWEQAGEAGGRIPGQAPVRERDLDPRRAFLEAFCQAAGISPEALAGRDQHDVAEELGQFVRVTVEQLGLLLKSRASAKAMTRSASRTVLGAADNNPLKFIPDPAEAAEAMFGRRRTGYLDARRSLEEAFSDLRRHELASYAAMQKALALLLEPLAPETIEAKAGSSVFSGKKGRAWDIYVERWEDRNRGENGLLDAFFMYFAQAYDEETEEIDLSS